MAGSDDLALGHGLAPADDPAIAGLPGDERRLLLAGQFLETNPGAGSHRVCFVFQNKARPLEQGHGLLAHRGSGGKARALHARQVQHTGGRPLDDEVRPVGVGPDARKVADAGGKFHAGHAPAGALRHLGKAHGGGGGVGGIRNVLGVGADDQIAVYRGGHQHALASGGGALEDDPAHGIAGGFVQQVILAPAGFRHKILRRGQRVHRARVHTGGVHHKAGFKFALCGFDAPAALDGGKAGDPGLQMQVGPIFHRVFRHGQRELPGAHDGRAGRVQGGGDLRREVRLQLPGLFAA